MSEHDAGHLDYRTAPRPVDRLATGVFGRWSDELRFGRMAGTVRLGGTDIAEPIVAAYDESACFIGTNILRHFRETFDLSQHRVRLERASSAPITTPPYRGIGAGFNRVADRWFVAYRMSGGPADRAGLQVDDEVLCIDGTHVRDLAAGDLLERIRTRDSLTFDVRRHYSGTLRIVVPVAEQWHDALEEPFFLLPDDATGFASKWSRPDSSATTSGEDPPEGKPTRPSVAKLRTNGST